MDLGNLLGAFGASNKETVYLSVTPDVGLELITVDVNSRTIKSYFAAPLSYNETTRDLVDYEQFKSSVLQLLQQANINPKCNVILNLPTVLFGYKDISIIIGNDAVSTVVTSEVEQSYLFRRSEPLIAWSEYSDSSSQETRRVFYTAVQSEVIENIKNALSQIGANLMEVEISLVSKLRALDFAGFATEQMNNDEPWNLLIINGMGYSICSMKGRNLIEYYEEAIPIKSFEGDEIYKAISASAQLTLMSYPARYLYIVSDTDEVSAEILANKLPVDGTLQFIENNKYKKREFIETSLDVLQDDVLKISLEAIGCTLAKVVNTNLNFNLLNTKSAEELVDPNEPVKVMIGNQEYSVTPQTANSIAMCVAGCFVGVAAVLMFLVTHSVKGLENRLQNVQGQVQEIENQLSQFESEAASRDTSFDIKTEMKRVLDANRKKLISYVALGEAVPNNLWITYFVTAGDGGVNIKGKAASVEDIYSFFTNMKESILESGLRLTKLELDQKDIDELVEAKSSSPTYYVFEITNMSYSEADKKDEANETDETGESNSENSANTDDQGKSSVTKDKPKSRLPFNNNNSNNMEPIPDDELE